MNKPKLSTAPLAHIVMAEPEIPWNTGNAGRSCLAFNAQLHMIRPLGFSLDEKAVKRAGLDYWQHVHPKVWDNWLEFEASMLPNHKKPWLITPEGAAPPWDADLEPEPVLIFGSETRGVSDMLRERYVDRKVGIPMAKGPIRSLNVSTTVGIMLYEIARLKHQKVSGDL